MKLHLGCGRRHLPGFVNVDADPSAGADVVADIRALPYDPASVSLIYACAVVEHLAGDAALAALRHWATLLRPQGRVRVSVPDFRLLAELYLHDPDVDLRLIRGPLMGGHQNGWDVHHSVWDFPTLANVLREAGYYNTRRFEPDECRDFPPGWDDYCWAEVAGRRIHLNVEATVRK